MEQSTRPKIAFDPIKFESKKCNKCNRKRRFLNKSLICGSCFRLNTIFIPSGNKVVDDFTKYTLIHKRRKIEFVPHHKFKDLEFIAEGGFSKIYKATWIDGPITNWNYVNQKYERRGKVTVALKELDNSKSIDPKELNELKIYYNLARNNYINEYYGITQDPITKNFMIITKYFESGDLTRYMTNDFFNTSWADKLYLLGAIIHGLRDIHDANIIHKDYHSGNIFIADQVKFRKSFLNDLRGKVVIGDLGISKSAIDNNDNEIYGIIPYVAPEIFQGKKYTKASDIYGFGMIMWELMTGRRPFWDQNHDTDLIIKICDGLRPPIVTNAPKGYIDLMKECWKSNPKKRPSAYGIYIRIDDLIDYEYENGNPTKIIRSPDIGPITAINSGAIYKSRPLSVMIKSAESTRSLKSQIISGISKRKFGNNNLIEDEIFKKIKSYENENINNGYLTKEVGFDIDDNINSSKSNNDANDGK